MPKTNYQDPGTSEIRSTHISGLQEAVGKVEDILDLQLQAEAGVVLTEVYISTEDRYRIYQAPVGKRNWASSPAPVIKKNDEVITEGFTIDYAGGAIIVFPPATSEDVFTADVSYTKTAGNKLDTHMAEKATEEELGHVIVDGTTITVDENGVISSTAETPIATTEIAGKVKPDGVTITIDEEGVITASSSGVPLEGTFTPVLEGSTTAGSNTYSTQLGYYRKEGRKVEAWGTIGLTAKDVAMAGNARIGGMPFAVSSPTGLGQPLGVVYIGSIDKIVANNIIKGYMSTTTSRLILAYEGDNIGTTFVTASEITATTSIQFYIVYYTS
jgi:hypothetical protein